MYAVFNQAAAVTSYLDTFERNGWPLVIGEFAGSSPDCVRQRAPDEPAADPDHTAADHTAADRRLYRRLRGDRPVERRLPGRGRGHRGQ